MSQPVLFMASSMHGGGSERQTLSILRHLDRERFRPQLYLTARVGDRLADVPADVPIHAYDDDDQTAGTWYLPGRILRRQVQHLRILLARESIAAVYDRTFPMTLIAGPAARSHWVPRISTIVSPPELAVPAVAQRFVALKRRRLRRAYADAARVVAVSRQAANSAVSYYGLPRERVIVVPNGVDCPALNAAAKAAPPPPRDATPTLVCVGRMTVEKGHLDLLQALISTESQWPSSRPPIRVWLVGDGPLRGDLEAFWRTSERRHVVEFLGSMANPAPVIAAADALVLPSHFEGMPNVVLEAMCLGTPVIATRGGGTVDLERETPTIFWAAPHQPQSLAAAILDFLRDRDKAAAHCRAASELVGQYHDVRQTTLAIEQLLDDAINEAAR